MIKPKTVILFLIILSSFICQSQVKPVLYGGVDYFRDVGFENNSYLDFNIGAQLFKWKFIAPEIGFEHYFGKANTKEQMNPIDPQARPPAKLETRFSTNALTLAPKLIFGNEEAALVIIPQFNYGKINTRGDLVKFTGQRDVIVQQQKKSQSIAYFSMAAGVEGTFYDLDYIHFSLFLKYNFLNDKEALSKLNVPESPLKSTGGSKEGLGLGARVYFDFLELLRH